MRVEQLIEKADVRVRATFFVIARAPAGVVAQIIGRGVWPCPIIFASNFEPSGGCSQTYPL